jgi:DNA-binding transcriptional regulator YiaG
LALYAPSMTGDQLRRLRFRWDLSQAAAAALIGVDGRTWRRWELGERNIPEPVARLVRLIDRLPAAWIELEKMQET